eukprot:scaffold7878_cov126-Isochrysis_galbana.AAC.5
MATETPSSPKRPRDPASDNKVSQGAITLDPVWPERQIVTTENLSTAPANACQSLAHPTTLMGRWLKSVDCWVLLCEGLQSRSTTTLLAARLKRSDNPVCLAEDLQTSSSAGCRSHSSGAEHATKPTPAYSGSLRFPNPQHAV